MQNLRRLYMDIFMYTSNSISLYKKKEKGKTWIQHLFNMMMCRVYCCGRRRAVTLINALSARQQHYLLNKP